MKSQNAHKFLITLGIVALLSGCTSSQFSDDAEGSSHTDFAAKAAADEVAGADIVDLEVNAGSSQDEIDDRTPEEVAKEALALCPSPQKRGLASEPPKGSIEVKKALNQISGLRGKTLVIGRTDDASTKLLKDSRGKTILCDVNVDEVKDTSGHLIFVRSRVKHIMSHSGRITLIDASADQMSGDVNLHDVR